MLHEGDAEGAGGGGHLGISGVLPGERLEDRRLRIARVREHDAHGIRFRHAHRAQLRMQGLGFQGEGDSLGLVSASGAPTEPSCISRFQGSRVWVTTCSTRRV